MATEHPNLVDFKYVTAGMFALAGSFTSIRLIVRARKRHWWWDDTLALVSMVVMLVFLVGTVLVLRPSRQLETSGYYIVVSGYYTTIWAARLSILFTIIRIAPWPRQRKILLCCSGFFIFQWLLLMVQVFWVCEITSTGWKSEAGTLCVLGNAVAIIQVITTLISDLILVFSPVWIIRRVHLNPGLRFRLISAFFVSIATTAAALVHSVLVIRSPGPWEAIFGAVEAGVAMTVCNASVLIPLVARMVSTSETFHENDETTTISGSGRKRRLDATKLSTLRIADPHNGTVRVDVTVDHDHPDSGWTQKGPDTESFEGAPSTKTNDANFMPI